MSNQAKELSAGIQAMGDKLTIPRSGFRSSPLQRETSVLRRVGDIEQLETRPQPVPKATPIKKPANVFDRITFEITPEQRAALTNIATTLNARVPRDKRKEKINRDMLMRAILSVADKLKWETADNISTETDLKRFVREQLSTEKKTADKSEVS